MSDHNTAMQHNVRNLQDLLNVTIFTPADPGRCAGCMYNTYLGCSAPSDYLETCPNGGR